MEKCVKMVENVMIEAVAQEPRESIKVDSGKTLPEVTWQWHCATSLGRSVSEDL